MCKSPLYAFRANYLTTKRELCSVYDKDLGYSVMRWFEPGTCVPVSYGDNAPKLKFVSFEIWEQLKVSSPECDFFRIPCGQCIDCRLLYSKEWATRIICESSLWKNNLFVTLTYDEEHLPRSIVDPSLSTLCYDHLQKFMKRLRRRIELDFGFVGLRFYAAGEYGDLSQRAHFHICLFNVPDQLMQELRFYKSSFQGDIYYISDYIQKVWGKGIVVCGDLCFQSAAYVARYVCKKIKGEKALSSLKELGIANQESRMSLRPGIGSEYFHLFMDDIYRNDELILPMVGKVAVSRYFDKLMEFEDPDFIAELKVKRAIRSEDLMKAKLSQTDLDEVGLLKSELLSLESKIKSLARPL